MSKLHDHRISCLPRSTSPAFLSDLHYWSIKKVRLIQNNSFFYHLYEIIMIREDLGQGYEQIQFERLAWHPSTTMTSIVNNGNISNKDASQPNDAAWPMTAIAYPGKHGEFMFDLVTSINFLCNILITTFLLSSVSFVFQM